MIIGQIKDGIVLDHITAGKAMQIYETLKLGKLDCSVAMIQNADSVKMGKKDIIKIGTLMDLNLDVLGYIDPGITVNVIRDGKIDKRYHLWLPERIVGVIKCKNPRCITSVEVNAVHEFRLADKEKKIYRCIYCEHQAAKLLKKRSGARNRSGFLFLKTCHSEPVRTLAWESPSTFWKRGGDCHTSLRAGSQ